MKTGTSIENQPEQGIEEVVISKKSMILPAAKKTAKFTFHCLGVISALILILDMFWLWIIPPVLAHFFSADVIINELQTKSHTEAILENLEYKTHADFTLSIRTNKASLTQDKNVILDASKTDIQMGVLPLLFNKFDLRNFVADNITLNIRRKKDGTFDILSIFSNSVNPKSTPDIKLKNLHLNNYQVSYTDELISEQLLLKGNLFNLDDFRKNKRLKIEAEGELLAGKSGSVPTSAGKFATDINTRLPLRKSITKSDFDFDLWLDEIDLKVFSPFANLFSGGEIIETNGKITTAIGTTAGSNGTKKIKGHVLTNNIQIKEKKPENCTYLKESSVVTIDTDITNNALYINVLELKNKHHNVELGGKITHLTAKKPKFDITLDLHNDKKSMLYWAIPSELAFEKNIISKIKKYGLTGTIDGGLEIKGELPTPNISGEFSVPDLRINQPKTRDVKADLKLQFLGQKLRVLADVKPSGDANVNVDGTINIYTKPKNAIFDIKSTNSVSLVTTRAILIPIQDLFNLNFGILNQLQILDGTGTATIHTEGTRGNPNVTGELNVSKAKASLNGINATLENVTGQLKFSGKDIFIETETATVNGSLLKLNGTASISGDFDINLTAPDVETQTLLNVLKTSELLAPITQKVKEINLIKSIKGTAEFTLNAKGGIPSASLQDKKPKNMLDIDYNGKLNTKNNIIEISGLSIPITIVSAESTFDSKNISAKATTKLNNSAVNLNADITDNKPKITANSNKFYLDDLLKIALPNSQYRALLTTKVDEARTYFDFKADYEGQNAEFEPNNVNLSANAHYDNQSSKTQPHLYLSQGNIEIKNGKAQIKNLDTHIFNALITTNGTISDIFTKNPINDLLFEVKNFDISTLNTLSKGNAIPLTAKKLLTAYGNFEGAADGWLKMKSSGLDGQISFRNVKFIHNKIKLPISIVSTDLLFKNDTMSIKALNAMLDDIPVFANIDIYDFSKKPTIKGYATSNIYPSFVNKYINANLKYPIKIKGELRLKTVLSGRMSEPRTSFLLSLPIGSDITYMGTSLDEEDFERELKLDITSNPTSLTINDATYSKYILSLNGTKTKYPYITMTGKLQNWQNLGFNNIRLKTANKTSAKFFNILFKKSILKSGDFECDLKINGSANNPNVLGFLRARNIDVPMFQSYIKDVFTDFKQNNLGIKVVGNIYETNLTILAMLENKLSAPFHAKSIDVKADYMDLGKVFDNLSHVVLRPHAELSNNKDTNATLPVSSSQILVDKGTITARKVLVKGFAATELLAKIKHGQDNITQVENFEFKIANGTISSSGHYDVNKNELTGDCIAKSIDANIFSQIFLNVKNQIYGTLDGTVNFTTQGNSQQDRLKNLDGRVSFVIKDGKMPKLGSLEYLLRAGNVIKSGITGFTVNNIIELLVPIKTGDFSAITGNIQIENGNASDIKLYSKGKNLSLYVTGNADLSSSHAEMIVYGQLAKKISNMLGPIGNASLNTLFTFIPDIKLKEHGNSLIHELNKIPGINLSTSDYRFFKAAINGDVNGENYVQTFKWIED